jgi:hypothetical protein
VKNNIIIAGVSRAGKSTLSNMLARRFGYQHVSMDAIIAGMEAAFPELGFKWWPSEATQSEEFDLFRNASEKVALFIRAMLESAEYDEFEPGMVADAFQLLPEHYMKYLSDKNCEIAYLITSEVTPEERFAIHRTYDTEKDYSFQFSDEEMLSHCKYVVERSRFLREQCEKYGLLYFETAKNRFDVFDQIIQSFQKQNN